MVQMLRCYKCDEDRQTAWSDLSDRPVTICTTCNRKSRYYTIPQINHIMSKVEGQRLIVTSGVIHREGILNNVFRECLCKCGNTCTIQAGSLTSGATRSCGCLRMEIISKKGQNHPHWRGGRVRHYGNTWLTQSSLVRKRDGNICQRCGKTRDENGRDMDVHHIKNFKSFGYILYENRNDIQANDLDNLICLCKVCHPTVEANPDKINDFRNEKGEICR